MDRMHLCGHASWPWLVVLCCVVLAVGCQDGSGPGLVTSPEGKPAYDGAKPPPQGAVPAISFHTMSGTQGSSLKVTNADGSNVATIYAASYSSQMRPSWSPDGRSLAFIVNDAGRTSPPRDYFLLMLINVNVVNGVPTGTNARILVDRPHAPILYYPAWSPRGDQVAFVDLHQHTLEVVPVAGGNPVAVYTSLQVPGYGYINPTCPAWSRDGSQIAFSEFDAGAGGTVIRGVNAATGEVTTLVAPEALQPIREGEGVWDLEWARTRDALTFATGFPRKIYTMDIPGGTPVFVVEGSGPAWSPNDAEIVFRRSTGKVSKVDLATGLITQFSTGGYNPDWRR